MDLFSLVAKLTLDTNEFSKELNKAEGDLKDLELSEPKLDLDSDGFNSKIEESQNLGTGFGSQMESVFGTVKTAIISSGVALAIKEIVGGLRDMVNMTVETADGIDKGSKTLGISTKKYQAWDYALRQSGAGINDVRKGIVNFQTALKAADPSTPFADAEDQVDGLADKTAGLSADAYEGLKSLGMLDKLIAGEYSSAEEMMEDALLRLADFDGSVEDRGIIVRQLFGRGGDVLNAMLDEGKAGVKELLGEAEKYGLIMSDTEIDQAVSYGDAVAKLKLEIQAIQQTFVSDLIPTLEKAVNFLTDLIAFFNPRTKNNAVAEAFAEIDAKTIAANRELEKTSATAQGMIDKLASMGDYWTLDEKDQMTWNALAEEFIQIYPQFEDFIDRENKVIRGNTEEIKENIRQWSIRERQRLLDENVAEKRQAVAEQYAAALDKEVQADVKEAEADGERLLAISDLNDELDGLIKHYEDMAQLSAERGQQGNADKYAKMAEMYRNARLSENASYDEFKASRDVILGQLDRYVDTKRWDEIMGIGSAWESKEEEVKTLRDEAEKLNEEAEEAEKNLEIYQQKLAERLKLNTDGISGEKKEVQGLNEEIDKIPKKVTTQWEFINPWSSNTNPEDDRGFEHSYAIGNHYIPYDQMALLHRGERVLTATENRQDNGSGFDFGHMEDVVAAAIRNGMDGVTVRSFLNGRDVTDEVNRINMQGIKGRRFSV